MKLHFQFAKSFVMLTLLFSTNSYAATNSITIKEEAGITTINYPIQIARPFKKGEISGYPQAIVNGTAVVTQADVKQRYSDGSVKHAIITFLIPSLQANSTITVLFVNQNTGNNAGYLNAAGMQNASYNFDATMSMTNGATYITSARTMLNANKFTYWMQGSVTTSVIIADHSLARSYDVAFDAYKTVRPIFHATFFPGINKVRVRFIGENANTETLQDQFYDLVLKLGYTSPVSVYTKNNLGHYAGTRWTKEYWIGGQPSKISINHNLAYLTETKAISNYDTSIVIPISQLDADYSSWDGWQQAPKDLYDAGTWTKAMGTTGGRGDIAPYPKWTVQWLYSGDWRYKEWAFTNADLAAAWPLHLREGNPNKTFDKTETISGVGKVVSIRHRKTFWSWWDQLNYLYTNDTDKVKPVGSILPTATWAGGHGWDPDGSHQPDPYYCQYLLSGDFFYLEEMQFWVSWFAASNNPCNADYCRGDMGEGAYNDQVRGEAWVLRNRARTAFISPDNTPEKDYFVALTNEQLAYYEGRYNITGSPLQNISTWAFAQSTNSTKWQGKGIPPLHYWSIGNSGIISPPVDANKCSSAESPWMYYFVTYVLGNVKELGFASDSLLAYASKNMTEMVTDPGYNPYYIAAYRYPTTQTNGNWFTSWSGVKTAFLSNATPYTDFKNTRNDLQGGYSIYYMAAASMCYCEPNGIQAWNWAKANIKDSCFTANKNPTWFIMPRSCNPDVSTDVKKVNDRQEMNLYPNPNNGIFSIHIEENKTENNLVRIFNSIGEEVFQQYLESEELIDIRGKSAGIYFVKILTTNNKQQVFKIVIE